MDGPALYGYRKRKRVTQQELEKALIDMGEYMPVETIRSIEHGDIHPSERVALAWQNAIDKVVEARKEAAGK